VYGVPNIGKTSLASLLPAPAFIDLDRGSWHLDVQRVGPAPLPDGKPAAWTWEMIRAALAADHLWEGVQTIVVDSGTRAQQIAWDFVVRTMTTDRGDPVANIEAFGYGKGYQHGYDKYLALLADLDRHVRLGRHVVLVCHACVDNRPNPAGDDFPRHEPDLYTSRSGKASIRNRVIEWADQMLFLNYDVIVDSKSGKARGGTTRTIYTTEMPSHLAKTRPNINPTPFVHGDDTIWRTLGCKS
jgi:hypothetical protein